MANGAFIESTDFSLRGVNKEKYITIVACFEKEPDDDGNAVMYDSLYHAGIGTESTQKMWFGILKEWAANYTEKEGPSATPPDNNSLVIVMRVSDPKDKFTVTELFGSAQDADAEFKKSVEGFLRQGGEEVKRALVVPTNDAESWTVNLTTGKRHVVKPEDTDTAKKAAAKKPSGKAAQRRVAKKAPAGGATKKAPTTKATATKAPAKRASTAAKRAATDTEAPKRTNPKATTEGKAPMVKQVTTAKRAAAPKGAAARKAAVKRG